MPFPRSSVPSLNADDLSRRVSVRSHIAVLDPTHTRTDPTVNGAEEDLTSASERFDALLAGLTEGIVITDSRGAIEQINRAACDMFDYNPDEIVGRSLAALLGSPNQDDYATHLRAY